VAVGKTKSGQVGGIGLMGINPSNFKALGITDPNDPTQNINGGAKLLSGLIDRFQDVPTALTHYVGGDDQSQWGPQTQAYPRQILANYQKSAGAAPPPTAPVQMPGLPPSAQPSPGAAPASIDPFTASLGSVKTAPAAAPQTDPFTASLASKPSTASAAPNTKPATPQFSPQDEQMAEEVAAGGMPNIPGAMGDVLGGMAHGAIVAPAKGLAQLGLKGIAAATSGAPDQTLSNWANTTANNIGQSEASYQAGASPGNQAAQVGGGLAAALMLPAGEATEGGNALMNLLKASGKGSAMGGGYGAAQPVTQPGNYMQQKLGQIGTGAAAGAIIPAVAAIPSGVAGAGGYVGNVGQSLIDPFTEAGQSRIATNTLQRFAQGGPTTINAAPLVQGEAPTLAEATGNPGIATLQRTIRDINPNPFVEREQANAAARLDAFGTAAGTPADIDAAQAARDTAAQAQLQSVFQNAKPANAQPVVDSIDSILNGPSGQRPAVSNTLNQVRNMLVDPQTGAAIPNADPNMLYNSVRKGIGDMIDTKMATSNPAGIQASRELLQVRDALDGQIEQAAPGFQNYLDSYSSASTPIDAMQYLQGLNLTDAQGNMTLSKVQNALTNLGKQANKPGVNAAQSISPDQISTLTAVRDSLLRGQAVNLGKSAGSNTAQNLATQNALSTALPGKVGAIVGAVGPTGIGTGAGTAIGFGLGGPIGASVGATLGGGVGNFAGRLMNGQNEAIQNRVMEMLLNPGSLGSTLDNGAAATTQPGVNSLMQRLAPNLIPAAITANSPVFGKANVKTLQSAP